MPGNTTGDYFRLTTFGESHGKAIGGIVDGCPPGISLDEYHIQAELDRRRPGAGPGASKRLEEDKVVLLSGVFEGLTTGAPISFLIANRDAESADYDHLKDVFRPSHADLSWFLKYGIRDHRGGGRASGRETACRVAGGAVAKQVIGRAGMKVKAYTTQIGNISLEQDLNPDALIDIESSPVRCPDPEVSGRMIRLIEETSASGDALGGTVSCVVLNPPAGLGEPVFDKLQADFAKAMMSIGTARFFEYGAGLASVSLKGSEYIDPYVSEKGTIHTAFNRSGGIQGGISTGETIYFKVGFSPVAAAAGTYQTVGAGGKAMSYTTHGRNDVCIIPRVVPVVEAMAALVLADHYLRMKAISE
jgi:chorismate synthase